MTTNIPAEQSRSIHLPNEILENIFSRFKLPGAAKIGRDRYESVNVLKGPPVPNQPPGYYRDNDLGTGACTHQHDEYKFRLRTMSAIAKVCRQWYKVVTPLLYEVYPGQTVVQPALFLRSVRESRQHAANVKQAVIDPCLREDALGTAHLIMRTNFHPGTLLDFAARTQHEEAYVILLLMYCSQVEVMDLTAPNFCGGFSNILEYFAQLRDMNSDTEDVDTQKAAEGERMPLHKLKEIHLHLTDPHNYRENWRLKFLIGLPTVHIVTLYRFATYAPILVVNCKNITELTLWRNDFDSAQLLMVLNTCTSLRSLSVLLAGFRCHDKLVREKGRLNMKELHKVLHTSLHHLQIFRLDDRELDPPKPVIFAPLRDGPPLKHLAINESCLGSYFGTSKIGLVLPDIPLADMLPETIQSLTIFRSNQWWHQADHLSEKKVISGEDGIYRLEDIIYSFDAIHDKIADFLRMGQEKCPDLETICLDTPLPFGRDVGQFGWRCDEVVGEEALERPSIVLNAWITPELKDEWDTTQRERAAKPGLVLRKVRWMDRRRGI